MSFLSSLLKRGEARVPNLKKNFSTQLPPHLTHLHGALPLPQFVSDRLRNHGVEQIVSPFHHRVQLLNQLFHLSGFVSLLQVKEVSDTLFCLQYLNQI